MQERDHERLQRSYRRAAVFGATIAASMFCYVAVVEVMRGREQGFDGFAPGGYVDVLLWLGVAVSLLLFVALPVLRRRLMNRGADLHGMVEQIMVPQERYRHMVTAVITGFVLCEAISVLGLTLFLLGGDATDFYVLFGLGLGLLVVHFPSYGRWRQWYAERSLVR